jgi:hypothetical protein
MQKQEQEQEQERQQVLPNAAGLRRFRDLSQVLCEQLRLANIKAVPWRDSELPHFAKLSTFRQAVLLKCFEAQIHIFHTHLKYDRGLSDAWSLTESFLQEMRLTPSPDLIHFLDPEDYIAVYDQNQTMIFLTPNHFNITSYSLEDFYCRVWIEMFRRDEQIEKILWERIVPFAMRKQTKTVSNEDIPPHFLYEVSSPEKWSGTCQSKAYSPIFQNDSPVGFISINQGFHASRNAPET